MPRNHYERVEVMFRLKDAALCRKVCGMILAPYLADTEKARFLQPDGVYTRSPRKGGARHPGGHHFNVQEFLVRAAENGEEGESEVALFFPRLQARSSAIAEFFSTVRREATEGSVPAEKTE
jgi:hypothetical protein